MKHGLIVGGGPVDLELLREELVPWPDLVIGADGGGESLVNAGRFPDVLIGDYDSLRPEVLERIKKTETEIFQYPPAKDQTDLELAVGLAIERGCRTLTILGGTGDRLDHTLGNIGLLVQALRKNVAARLVDSMHEIVVIDQAIELTAREGWAVSLIPLTPVVSRVTTSGLLFPLLNEDLFFEYPRGIHNEFLVTKANVSIRDGLLAVILFKP